MKPKNRSANIHNSALITRHSILCLTLCALLFALCSIAEAQQAPKLPRIGFLSLAPAGPRRTHDAFRQGLRELGYVEGRNIMIEDRSASDNADRLAALAAELVDVRVDLIVAAGSQAVRAAQHATKAIPIVMTSSSDPVGTHFVASLARPGGNITGLSLLSPDLSTKRLELLEEIVKPLTRAAVFWNPDDPPANISLRETQEAAKALGVQLSVHETRDAKDFESAFGAAIRDGARGLILLPAPLLNSGAKAIARLALKNRIPAISYASEYPDAGGRQADRISNSPQHFS